MRERCWHHDWYRSILRKNRDALLGAVKLQEILKRLLAEDRALAEEKKRKSIPTRTRGKVSQLLSPRN